MITIICKNCGSKKKVFPYKIKNGRGNFCCIGCYNTYKKTEDHKSKIYNWFKAGAAAMRLKGQSPEARKRISNGIKLAYASGKPHGWTGHHHTEEEKKRRRESKLGVPFLNLRGENCPQWRGGITPVNHRIRTSIEAKIWRRSVFNRDNYTCVECGVRGGNLEADHIKPFAAFPELRFDISNGRTLCVACHRKTETWGNGTKRIMEKL